MSFTNVDDALGSVPCHLLAPDREIRGMRPGPRATVLLAKAYTVYARDAAAALRLVRPTLMTTKDTPTIVKPGQTFEIENAADAKPVTFEFDRLVAGQRIQFVADVK